MAKIVEEQLDSLNEVHSQIMDVELQMEFLAKKLSALTKVLRSRSLVRKSIVCGWCGHSEWSYNIQLTNPQFNLQCEICGKEGCEHCTDWYVDAGIKHFRHKYCVSEELEKQKEEQKKQKESDEKEEAMKQRRKERYEELKEEFED